MPGAEEHKKSKEAVRQKAVLAQLMVADTLISITSHIKHWPYPEKGMVSGVCKVQLNK